MQAARFPFWQAVLKCAMQDWASWYFWQLATHASPFPFSSILGPPNVLSKNPLGNAGTTSEVRDFQ
jgi:hypothetical protein